MPRTTLPADYDLGFLRLRADGAVVATFRINYLFVATQRLECKADIRDLHISISRHGPEPLAFDDITDEDLENLFPPSDAAKCVVFSSKLTAAKAYNTNSGFRLYRHNTVSVLEAWRSHHHRVFVHYGGSWVETDAPDAHQLVNSVDRHDPDEGIPF